MAHELGVKLSFHRVPVSDERVFGLEDFDDVTKLIRAGLESMPDAAFLFNWFVPSL